MEERPEEDPASQDSSKKGKLLLEERSKDDLVKLVNKQLILLRKAKNKSDELSQKCSLLVSEKEAIKLSEQSARKEVESLQEQLNAHKKSSDGLERQQEMANAFMEAKSEILRLEEELKVVQKERDGFCHSYKENEEQAQCLVMQLETVKATCQCFQDELKKLQDKNKELKEEVVILTEARDTALQSLKTQKLNLDQELKNAQHESNEIKKKYSILIEENCALSSRSSELEHLARTLEKDNVNLVEKYDQMKVELNANAQQHNKSGFGDLSILLRDNEELKTSLEKLETESCELKIENDKLQKENIALKVQHPESKSNETEKKYSILIEENCALSSRSSELENLIKALQKDNMKLLRKYDDVTEELKRLKLSTPQIDRSDFGDLSIMLRDNEELKTALEKLEAERCELKIENDRLQNENSTLNDPHPESKNFFDRATSSKLCAEELQEKNKLLSKEIENLVTERDELRVQLNECEKDKNNLQEEIKRLSENKHDEALAFEHAILHGAHTKDISTVNKDNDSKKSEEISIVEQQGETHFMVNKLRGFDTEAYEAAFGVEYALLEGMGSNQICNVTFDDSSTEKALHSTVNFESSVNNVALPADYQNLILMKEELVNKNLNLELQINTMKKNFSEYAAMLQETLDENKLLKMKLEGGPNKSDLSVFHVGVNTEVFDTNNTPIHDPECQEETNADSSEIQDNELIMREELEATISSYVEKCNSLSSDLDSLTKNMEALKEEKSCIERHAELVEKHNIEISEKLENKSMELDDFNLQLEQLILSFKQGVRQKTTTIPLKSEKLISENLISLKLLLDELNTHCNARVKKLEVELSEAAIQRQNLRDELLQLKELNQFLEDEIEQLKSECSQAPFEKHHAELYSIEEANENEEKTGVDLPSDDVTKCDAENNIPDVISNDEPSTSKYDCDISAQTGVTLSNISTQVECDDLSDNYHKLYDDLSIKYNSLSAAFEDTSELLSKFQARVSAVNEENRQLKASLNDKSNLVEQIHCTMDSLLINVEELNVQLGEKTSELEYLKDININLKKSNHEFQCVLNENKNALTLAKGTLTELKNMENCLKDDINLLSSYSKQQFHELNTSCNEIINVTNANSQNASRGCLHSERDALCVSYLNEMHKDFDVLQTFIEKTVMLQDDKDISECEILENFKNFEVAFHNRNSMQFDFSIAQNQCKDSHDEILKNMENLYTARQKLFHIINSYVENSISSKTLKDLKNTASKIQNISGNVEVVKCQNCKQKELPEMSATQDANVINNNMKSEEKSQADESELKMNKLKMVALKLKKELSEVKKQYDEVLRKNETLEKQAKNLKCELDDISTANRQCMQNYQSLQNEYDKLQDEYEAQTVKIHKLEEDLSKTSHELSSFQEQSAELDAQLKKCKEQIDSNLSLRQESIAKCADLENKIVILEAVNADKMRKLQDLESEIQKSKKEVSNLNEEKKEMKKQLELAQNEGKKKNLLDLEMADYERSITELHNQVQRKDNEITELQNDLKCQTEKIQSLQEEIKFTESLKETETTRAENFKQILERTKIELMTVKEHETELLNSISILKAQLEAAVQREEDYKLHLSEASSEIQHLKDILKTSSENHQRIVRSFETKVTSQAQEIIFAHKEIESIKQNFENYKIRVHSVLKQKESSTPFPSVDADLKEKLETINENLKLQVNTLSEKLTAVTLEYETIQGEYDLLLQKFNKAVEEHEKKDAEWHTRLEQINSEKSRLRATQEEMSSQHLLQNEMLVATYKKQIKILSEEHKRTVNEQQKQLDAADIEIARLQRDQHKVSATPSITASQESSVPFDIFSQERQEGEGSESTEGTSTPIKHLSLATIPTSGFLPFEKLLQSPLEPGTPTTVVSNHDSEKLSSDLNTANKKIDHLSELLNDSESTTLRMSEQVRVLKEEVRRLERNKEREQHAENLEYLKNILVKFATLQPGSEKAMLIPVLTTMLKLSPLEQQQLKSVAGAEVGTGTGPTNDGWGSYLHRWSGLI